MEDLFRGIVVELLRREGEQGGSSAMRVATITAVDSVGKLVKTSLTGDEWLQYPLWWSPIASDVGLRVLLTEQDEQLWVSGLLA